MMVEEETAVGAEAAHLGEVEAAVPVQAGDQLEERSKKNLDSRKNQHQQGQAIQRNNGDHQVDQGVPEEHLQLWVGDQE